MGIYDRDYYGEPRSGGGAISLLATKPIVVILIAINVIVFVLDFLLNHQLLIWGGLNRQAASHPLLWYQTLTYGFLHAGPQHILFNMLGLFFLGPPVEARLGRAEFLRFYLLSIILGGIFWMIRVPLMYPGVQDLPLSETMVGLVGASGGVSAVVMLFVFLYPHAELLLFFAIPIKAWVFGVLIIGANLLQIGDSRTAFDVHLVGIGFAIAYHMLHWDLSWLSFGWFGQLRQRIKRSRGPKLRVHRPETTSSPWNAPGPDIDSAEADRILEKIHREGEASLTAGERKILEEYSRRMRTRRGK